MPDCSSQQAALDLATATEAVAYAEYIVSTAEATLAMMEYYAAMGATSAARMALMYCESGYGGMAMSSPEKPEFQGVTITQQQLVVQRDAVKRFKAIHQASVRRQGELIAVKCGLSKPSESSEGR